MVRLASPLAVNKVLARCRAICHVHDGRSQGRCPHRDLHVQASLEDCKIIPDVIEGIKKDDAVDMTVEFATTDLIDGTTLSKEEVCMQQMLHAHAYVSVVSMSNL